MNSSDELSKRVLFVRERVEAAARRSGRPSDGVRLLAVTKGVSADAIEAACRAGIRMLGESRLQDTLPKQEQLPGIAAEWHFLGRLQSNKLEKILSAFDVIQSFCDRPTLAEAHSRLAARGMKRDAYLQVNISGEAQKGGCTYSDAAAILESPLEKDFPGLRVCGLMGIGPLTQDQTVLRQIFNGFRTFFDKMKAVRPQLETLSMGMSGDFEIAVEEGSTMVRVGTLIFGERK